MTRIGFHEATIRDIHSIDRVVVIILDEAVVAVDSLRMEREDGEILSLSETMSALALFFFIAGAALLIFGFKKNNRALHMRLQALA